VYIRTGSQVCNVVLWENQSRRDAEGDLLQGNWLQGTGSVE